MALSRIKNWNPGDTLTASDLNGEFNNIINNPITLVSPTTGSINFNLQGHTNFVLEGLSAAPVATTSGRVWYQTAAKDVGLDVGVAPTVPISRTVGQCRLDWTSASQLTLRPYQGNKIPLKTGNAWEMWTLPATVTISNVGTTQNTVYYVYAYNNSGTITLTLSTASHASDTNTGVEVMSTDSTRTLVGITYINGSTQFGGGLVTKSWFNPKLGAVSQASANGTTTSITPVEIATSGRVTFLVWSSEYWQMSVVGYGSNNVAGGSAQAFCYRDAVALASVATVATSRTANDAYTITSHASDVMSSAGTETIPHNATLYGQTGGSGTASFTFFINALMTL